MSDYAKYDNDHLYTAPELEEVINRDLNYKGWYMRMFWRLGKDEVLKLAAIARADGRDKKRYFSKLLRESFDRSKNGA